MINGFHVILYSSDSEADRSFFSEVLALPEQGMGSGGMIHGLPAGGLEVFPSSVSTDHEFYLRCEDLDLLVEAVQDSDGAVGPIQQEKWGRHAPVTLPGGSAIVVYEERASA